MKKVTRLLATATLIAAGFFFAACSDSSDSGSNETAGGETTGGEAGSGETTGGETTGGEAGSGETTGGGSGSGETAEEETIQVEVIEGGFVKVPGKEIDGTEAWSPESEVFVPGRKITIRNLIVSDHEVTQKEYKTYCWYYGGLAPRDGDNFPAYYVSWYDAIVYCNLRSIAEKLTPVYKLDGETDPKKWVEIRPNEEKTKYCWGGNSQWDEITMDIEANGYRLPTVAEWEYLARGGKKASTTYSGSNDIDEVAWYEGNSDSKTHEVKGKEKNNFNLYDMSGNVWEWCWDWYKAIDRYEYINIPETGATSGSSRCLRGGSWKGSVSSCSVFDYNIDSPSNIYRDGGFRVVRTDNSK